MPDFDFRNTKNFDDIADHLSEHCGISRELASKRLHEIKADYGLGGADNVVFGWSGDVYIEAKESKKKLELIGSLTFGGKKEKA